MPPPPRKIIKQIAGQSKQDGWVVPAIKGVSKEQRQKTSLVLCCLFNQYTNTVVAYIRPTQRD